MQHRAQDVWTIGLVTGPGLKSLNEAAGDEMVTVFVPSTPTAFSGYVVVVPRHAVVELPLTVEEAMRLLVTGGVLGPAASKTALPLVNPSVPAILPGAVAIDRPDPGRPARR